MYLYLGIYMLRKDGQLQLQHGEPTYLCICIADDLLFIFIWDAFMRIDSHKTI